MTTRETRTAPAGRGASDASAEPGGKSTKGGKGADKHKPPAEQALSYFSRRHRFAPGTAALLTFVVGVLNVLSAITPAIRSRARGVREFVPGALAHSAAALTLVLGVVMILLARALRRRKRRAWRATVVLLAASIVSHLAKGLDVEARA